MRREHLLSFLGGSLLLAMLGLAACGGGGGLGSASSNRPGNTDTPQAPAAPEAGAPRNTLRLSVPALAELAPGDEFEAVLAADTVEPLFQASARLMFDPAQLEPLRSSRGAGLATGQLFVSRADASLRMAGRGYVPFAFTGQPDTPGLAPGRLELLRVRFRVRSAISSNAGLQLLSDPAYLQLRAPGNRRISFDLHEEVAAR